MAALPDSATNWAVMFCRAVQPGRTIRTLTETVTCEPQAKLQCFVASHFLADCIDEWLVRDNTCPLCKRSVWSPPSSKQQSATDPSAAQTGAAASEDPAQADEPSATLSPSDAASAPNSALVTATSAAEVAIVIVPAAAAEEAEEEKEAEAEAGAAAAGGVAGPSPSQSATAGSAGQLVPPSMQQQQSAAQVNQGQQQSLEVVVV